MAFGLYLHFPFCRHRCAYCDFYKETYDRSIEARFYDALRTETELAFQSFRERDLRTATLYIGGGTPSLTSLDRLHDWLEQAQRLFPRDPSSEFSFEINPESCSRELLQTLLDLGVNRPVFGVQSFSRKLLKLLSRKHELRQVHEAIYLTNALGYDDYGCDLLYGMPGQTGKMLSSDLDQMTDLDPPHISFYQLTVEPRTELAKQVDNGKLKVPDADFVHALYQAGYEHFKENGYERYEVCSFAKPGHECRHNLDYWTGGDYLGLGPSAHSFIGGRRFSNVANVYEYVESLEKGRRPTREDRSGPRERMFEAIMLGFRTARGIDRVQFEKRFGRPLSDAIDSRQYELLLNSGHLIDAGDYLRLSDDALILADEITRRLTK